MKRFLITTALESTWCTDEPVLFLGEWCRLYSRKERWARMNAEVLPYHWDDREQFFADYQFLNGFYERLLVHLARRLNQIHGVDHEIRYWRILVGPWLAYFLQILFDRWSSIRQAVSRFEISGTVILNEDEDALVPNDMVHFIRLMVGDEWNHHIYAVMLQQFTKVPCIGRDYKGCTTTTKTTQVGLKQAIAASYTRMASYFVRDRDAFFIKTYLPLLSEMMLHRRFGQIPLLWRSVQPVRVSGDREHRKWMMAVEGQTDFEKCALALIPKQIPTLYLEGYKQLVEQTRKLPWPKHPKVIFTSNVLFHDTVSMAYTAQNVELGTPLVYGQHGGVYGVAKFTWAEEHEVAISDRYLTWGWSVKTQPKIRPVGILKVPTCSRRISNARQQLLLVTLNQSRYSYRLSSETCVVSERHLSDSFRFTSSLPRAIQKSLIVRLSHRELGWHLWSRWQDRFPNVALDSGSSRMRDLMRETRLAVYNYNSTGYLEAFAENVPAVLFCDLRVSPLRDSAVSYFKDLKRVGIFHETPDSAARHVTAIWDDVDAWWSSPALREVLERFKARYCQQPDNLLDSVEHALREVMAVSDRSAM